ncbi:MAG: hypothetical protein AVDCRST_MAG54-3027, partial [uncultured Actinomycetospora sp.]
GIQGRRRRGARGRTGPCRGRGRRLPVRAGAPRRDPG